MEKHVLSGIPDPFPIRKISGKKKHMNRNNQDRLGNANASSRRIILRSLLSWLVIIAIFLVIFSQIKMVDVLAVLKQTEAKWVCIAILFSLSAHLFFSSLRYQNTLAMMGYKLSFYEAVIIRMGCNAIKGVLPFKMGELTILAYMKRKHDLSYSLGIFSLLFGFCLSLMALVLYCSFGGIFYFQRLSVIMIFALISGLLVFFISFWGLQKIPGLLTAFLARFQKLPAESMGVQEPMKAQGIKRIFFHSLVIEGSKLLIIFTVLKSFHVEIPFAALLFLGSAAIIAAYLPITHWSLGIRESAVLFLFSGYATPEKLLAGGLLITLIDGLLPAILGLFFIKPFLNVLWERKK